MWLLNVTVSDRLGIQVAVDCKLSYWPMKVAKCTEFGHSILLCRIDDRLIWARDRLSGAIPLFVAISDWL